MKRLAIVLVLLSACSTDGGSGRVGSPASLSPSADAGSAQAGGDARQAPDPALQRFYDQQPAWKECDDFECARIEVPLDYDEPEGATIELALLKNPADDADKRVGSLVVNPGGPGAPGTSYAGEQAAEAFRDPLRDRFDIVGFDPRGTGSSTPLDCLSDADLDAYIAFDPDPDSPAEVREFQGWTRRMGQGCAEKSGELAQHVSTYEAARDMDVIRAVLGESTLTYFGASYGTKLGATYAGLFPERAGRLVLDGAVDISLPSRQASLQQARGFQVALEAYVDDCLADGSCYLGATKQAALDRIRAFLDSVDRAPIEVGDRELAVGNAFYGVVLPLYSEKYWTILDSALQAGFDGDGALLLQLSDLYSSREADGTYADNSSEAIGAINCLDDSWSIPIRRVPRHFAAFEKASPTFGRVFAWGLTGCSGLAFDAPEFDWSFDAAGAAPLLVIGTTRDPATPMRWARALAAQLDPAVLVTRDGDGHTGYNQDNACVDEVVEDYLIQGEVPDADVDCPAP